MWGVIIALLFGPLNQRLLPRVRQRPNVAALLTLLLVLTIVVLPLSLVATSLVSEASTLYQGLQSGTLNPSRYFRDLYNALPNWVTAILDRLGLTNFSILQREFTEALTRGSRFVGNQAFTIGQNTFDFVTSVFITLYLAFYFLRDGDTLLNSVRRAAPLTVRHTDALLEQFTTVVRATVKGNLVVAAVQGTLGGLAFWFLGVGATVLWAVLMACLSLLPAIGAALVWFPVAVYFLITGAVWQGVSLMVYGVLVIGLVDNLLRPALVGQETRMPDYLILLTTIGGMAVFGINGFVLGPAIAAMFIAVLHIYNSSRTLPMPTSKPTSTSNS